MAVASYETQFAAQVQEVESVIIKKPQNERAS